MTWDKWKDYERGVAQANAFLTLNEIPIPEYHDTSLHRAWRNFRVRLLGRYKNREVFVHVATTTTPRSGRPVRAWSYPGWKADTTASGVVAHEVGHWVDDFLSVIAQRTWKSILGSEARVSGYEPNAPESFAEAVKVFITNPNLLKLGRPRRWFFLTEVLKLKPLHDRPWAEVLKDASPYHHSAAVNWIKQGAKK